MTRLSIVILRDISCFLFFPHSNFANHTGIRLCGCGKRQLVVSIIIGSFLYHPHVGPFKVLNDLPISTKEIVSIPYPSSNRWQPPWVKSIRRMMMFFLLTREQAGEVREPCLYHKFLGTSYHKFLRPSSYFH